MWRNICIGISSAIDVNNVGEIIQERRLYGKIK